MSRKWYRKIDDKVHSTELKVEKINKLRILVRKICPVKKGH